MARIPPIYEDLRFSVPIREQDYLRFLRRFDSLWESATSERDQREMQRLIAFIESYEEHENSFQRSIIMNKASVQAIPAGMHTVTPHLVCAGVSEAISFYTKAFSAIETARLPGPDGKIMHAQIRIGDSTVMLMDEMPDCGAIGPKMLKGTPVTIHLYVEDADAVFGRAVAAGASVKYALEDTFWGDRYGVVEDPFGHHWSIATHIRDVSPEEMKQAMQSMSA